MSYILDAIRKSEAERNRGVSPGALASISERPISPGSRPVWIAIILTNVVLLGGWWLWQSPSGVAEPPNRAAANESRKPPVQTQPSASPTSPASPAPAESLTSQTPRVPATSESTTSLRESAAPARPQAVRRPALPEVSTHVFADDPALRAVTVHGRRLTEGELIEPGLRLEEITETGVIVEFQGQSFEFDVLQDWRS